MGVENPLFARCFDRFCGRDRGNGERELRRELLAGASGRVVEVGPGNGINFEHYPPSVAELIAVEPEPYLRGQAEKGDTVWAGIADAGVKARLREHTDTAYAAGVRGVPTLRLGDRLFWGEDQLEIAAAAGTASR